MYNKLVQLKNKNYYPDVILDIGAYKGEFTNEMRKIYDCEYYLFEPNTYEELKSFKDSKIKIFCFT